MSALVDGPWRCGSCSCPKDDDCKATVYNRLEAEKLASMMMAHRAFMASWEAAWLRAYGQRLPSEPTPRDARRAVEVDLRRRP
jgi:hypothetical protein